MCGAWLQDPELYTEQEQDKAKLVYCDSCGNEESNKNTRITRDMAIDAGDLSLEGSII